MAEGLVVAGEALVVVSAPFKTAGRISRSHPAGDPVDARETLAAGETWIFGDKGRS